jgi:Domain of unknown function (DUF3854)/Protein of unknown function (DUF3987)
VPDAETHCHGNRTRDRIHLAGLSDRLMTAGHDPQLTASAVSEDTAKRASVTRVSSNEARDLGFGGNGYDAANLAGIAFPYRDPRTGHHLLTRLRPDVPVNGRKYLAPTGSRNHLYMPIVTESILTDTRVPVVLTEGEKKTLAIAEAASSRYLAVGISGVWNWRTSDKEKRPLADHPGTKTVRVNSRPIEDLDWIAWRNRAVYVVFDSDGAKNPDVRNAEAALCAELRKRGASPLVVSLSATADGRKQGIDDVLAGVDAGKRLATLEQLLRSATPRRRARVTDDDKGLDLQWEPTGGFMRTFDAFADEQTDAPAVYRPFTALNVLSAVVGRRVTMQWFGASALVPNLYTCLLGASSFAHKTTMITMAERLIRRVRPEILLPDEFTPEKLLGLLETSPEAFLGLPEFAGFLARASRDYNAGTRELLMQLYDCPEEYRRSLQSKDIRVKSPAVNVLAASATSWLSDAMNGGDLRSGFFNRFCFVVGERQDKVYALPGTAATGQLEISLMTEQLKAVATASGTADWSKVRRTYEAWYRDLARDCRQIEPVEVLSAFYTRLAAAAMKIALLLEVSQGQSLTISDATMQEAIVLVDYLRAAIKHLLRIEFAPTKFAKQVQRVLELVKKRPGIKRGNNGLLQQTGYKSKELEEILDTLKQQGAAYEDGGGWWPA